MTGEKIPGCFDPSRSCLYVLSIVFTGYVVFQLTKILWRLGKQKFNAPPGSKGFPLLGETMAFLAENSSSKGVYNFVRTRRERYGNCFRTNIFGKTHIFVSSTKSAKFILSNDVGDFRKRYIKSIAMLLGEHSVLCASQDQHRRIRQRLANLFTRETLTSFIRLFDKLTVQIQSKWKQKGTVIILEEALKVTFQSICKILLSLEQEDELESLQNDVNQVSEAMLALPLRLPWTRFFRGLQARRRIGRTIRKMIDARQRGQENHEDFLQALLRNNESSTEDLLTDAQIEDNILTLIIAGQVTTASAITWMVKYLDENQEVQDKLRDMQIKVANKVEGKEFGTETLNEMSYASKVVKETLRMATIVSWFPLIALKDCEVEGFQIRKGWIVNVDARYIHNDETIYNDPTKFCPSRFDEDPKPYGFLAFGTGGRTCLGMNFAKAMMIVFLHRLITSYRWEVTDPDTSLEKHALFPRLRSGCPIRITPIQGIYNS